MEKSQEHTSDMDLSPNSEIAILTYHRAHNYGALLQAVALRKVLTKLGFQTRFLDYWPDYHKGQYESFNFWRYRRLPILAKLNYIRKFVLEFTKRKKRISTFSKFINEFITPYCLKPDEIKNDLRFIVYGSDQIWRNCEELGGEIDSVYLGVHKVPVRHHIAYAASMGIISERPQDKNTLKNTLSTFDLISVRESDLQELLLASGLDQVEKVVDPTLLLTEEEWRQALHIHPVKSAPYVLFYDLKEGSFDLEAVKSFATSKGMPLKILRARTSKRNYGQPTIDYANPREFVELIANASYVFASSYHGTVFSLIFRRQFFSSFRENSSRAASLLDSLGLGERLLSPKSTAIPSYSDIDYARTGLIMEKLRDSSIKFLSRLQEIK